MLRSLLLLFGSVLVSATLGYAQSFTACQNGTAGTYPCERIDLGANLDLALFEANQGNDIWGWTDPQTDREYALVGLDNGTAFVDVTEPTAPFYLGKLPTSTSSTTWRDIKVYADHAFIVSEASEHGMQVFDLTRLRAVAAPPEIFAEDALYTGAGKVHNIVVDPEAGFAYLVGANQPDTNCNGGGLHIVDIRTPQSPTYAGCYDDDGYVHDAQCITYQGPDSDYVGRQICATSSTDHISFVDVTDKEAPVLISSGFYANPAYTHQNWFTDDRRYLFVGDELDETGGLTVNTRTIVFDVEDLDSPEFLQYYFSLDESIDHNLYIRGRYVFQSNYETGLRVLDIADLASGVITEVANFDTYPDGNAPTFNGQWSNYPFFPSGTIITNDQNYGLFVLAPQFPIATDADTSGPEVPGEAGFVLTDAAPNPFRDQTRLRLSVSHNQQVRADLYDRAGRHVLTVQDGTARAASPLFLTLDGSDLPSGLYLLRVTGERFTTTRRVSLIR